MHPIHIELTATTLEIASHMCWMSDEGYDLIVKSLQRLYPDNEVEFFLRVLQMSKNAAMVATVATFMITLVEASTVNEERERMKEVFLQGGISNILK